MATRRRKSARRSIRTSARRLRKKRVSAHDVVGGARSASVPAGGPGHLVVLSAPSGSGKTTIAHEILKRNPQLAFSVSATTRPRREGEVDGKDYYFLSREEFLRRVAAGEFTEWEEIYGQCYGTLNAEIERAIASGRHLLFDIDVNGALSIKKRYPSALLIFIAPPSVEVLRERLQSRRTEDAATFARRMERVPMELEKGKRFDIRVVNDDLHRAVAEVQKIVENRLKKSQRRKKSDADQAD